MRKKAKEKQQSKAKLVRKAKQRDLESACARYLRGSACVECQQPITSCLDVLYIVKAKVWQAAGMARWDSGYLHEKCLEKRLGRKLVAEDYYVRPFGPDEDGRYRGEFDPVYADFLKTKNADRLDDPEWWRGTLSH